MRVGVPSVKRLPESSRFGWGVPCLRSSLRSVGCGRFPRGPVIPLFAPSRGRTVGLPAHGGFDGKGRRLHVSSQQRPRKTTRSPAQDCELKKPSVAHLVFMQRLLGSVGLPGGALQRGGRWFCRASSRRGCRPGVSPGPPPWSSFRAARQSVRPRCAAQQGFRSRARGMYALSDRTVYLPYGWTTSS